MRNSVCFIKTLDANSMRRCIADDVTVIRDQNWDEAAAKYQTSKSDFFVDG
jgi:hypothetical protein